MDMGRISKFYFTYLTSRAIKRVVMGIAVQPSPITTPAGRLMPTPAAAAGRDIVGTRPLGAAPPDPRGAEACSSARWRMRCPDRDSLDLGSTRRSAAGCRRSARAARICSGTLRFDCGRRDRERELTHDGAPSLETWASSRPIRAAVMRAQRDTRRRSCKSSAGFDDGRQPPTAALYRAQPSNRPRSARAGGADDHRSLSTRTVGHKSRCVTPDALDRFFHDLADERCHLAVHSSSTSGSGTNTSADWAAGAAFSTLDAQRRDNPMPATAVDCAPARGRQLAAGVQRRRADLDAGRRLVRLDECDRAAAGTTATR